MMTPLRAKVIDAYREELRKRYSVENVSRFPNMRRLNAEIVEELREFFLTLIYTDSATRETFDAAFENLGSVLRNPRKLMPFMTTAISSLWKLGTQFPAAVSAGWRTLEAYLETRRLEKTMIEVLEKLLQTKSISDLASYRLISGDFRTMITGIPLKEVERFQGDTVLFFESLSNKKLLRSTIEIMQESLSIMDNRRALYSPEERAGLDYGYKVLAEGYRLFEKLNDEEIKIILEGIVVIEKDWYDRMVNSTDQVTNSGH